MIFLSFDTEEFDVPREHGIEYYSLKEGIDVSIYGIERVLEILGETSVKATFFCTSTFVLSSPKLVKKILTNNHEIASHGCNHWMPQAGDASRSKKIIEDALGIKITGYRQPRMFSVDSKELSECGYKYNASLNPTFIPGKYLHLTSPRVPWIENKVVQIPASVSPHLRIPMFWLSMHHMPLSIYLKLAQTIIKHDGNFNTYFHPWELYPLNDFPDFKIPYFVRKRSGEEMCIRIKRFIDYFLKKGEFFGTYNEYANETLKRHETCNSIPLL